MAVMLCFTVYDTLHVYTSAAFKRCATSRAKWLLWATLDFGDWYPRYVSATWLKCAKPWSVRLH